MQLTLLMKVYACSSETGSSILPYQYDPVCQSWHGVSVLSLFITGCLHKTGTAHLAAYLHCKSVASCRACVLLLKMHEQSVQERPLGPRSAACLKDSWKKGCPLTRRYEGEKTLAGSRPSLTTLQSDTSHLPLNPSAWANKWGFQCVYNGVHACMTNCQGDNNYNNRGIIRTGCGTLFY